MTIDLFRGQYGFLSNFASCKVTFEGMEYPSVEAAFQAAKTKNLTIRQEFVTMTDPVQAKRRGTEIKNSPEFRDDWYDVNTDIMKGLLREKFCKNKYYKDKLIGTGDAELVEGNYWHDSFWGICSCKKCQAKEQFNYLGRFLMELREELKNS